VSTTSELAHLFRALKAPAAARALPKLADRARQEEWSYEQFAHALLETEHASRETHGGEGRIRAARLPARKTLEEFDFSFQRSVKKTLILHLGQLDFLIAKENVLLLGPPGTGTSHLVIALGIRACLAGERVLFRTATEWVAALGDARRRGQSAARSFRPGTESALLEPASALQAGTRVSGLTTTGTGRRALAGIGGGGPQVLRGRHR
jgi:DNA replication protein DnaC